MPDLVLYKKDSCPFCQKVLRFMASRGIELPMRDTALEPGARDELVEKGGKGQVPCLFIDGQALYESDDIIAWLGKNFA